MTKIQWTDETWNPTTGCSRVSEGCRNCYIERTPPFRMGGRNLGDPVQLHARRLYQPTEWKKPRRVFVNSLSDLFHDDIPEDFIKEVFTVMAIAKRHSFQILTKRPRRMMAILAKWTAEEMYDYWHAFSGEPREVQCWPLPNVWMGVSVENQHTADERIPILLQTPAAVRFISAEPLLGPVNLREINPFDDFHTDVLDTPDPAYKLNWIIVGGESGPKARPCDLAWIRSIVQQCQAAQVPCFVKQLGSDPIHWTYSMEMPTLEDCKITDKKGGDLSEWPADLRVREWPR